MENSVQVNRLLVDVVGAWWCAYADAHHRFSRWSCINYVKGEGRMNLCHHCRAKVMVRKRQFSDRAWAALVDWGEVRSETMGKSLCDDCYIELREIPHRSHARNGKNCPLIFSSSETTSMNIGSGLSWG